MFVNMLKADENEKLPCKYYGSGQICSLVELVIYMFYVAAVNSVLRLFIASLSVF